MPERPKSGSLNVAAASLASGGTSSRGGASSRAPSSHRAKSSAPSHRGKANRSPDVPRRVAEERVDEHVEEQAAGVVATPASAVARRADAGPETKSNEQRLQSISVLFPKTLAVPTLGAALNAMPALSKQVIVGAQAKAMQLQQTHILLSPDEVAAIILYTHEDEPAQDSLYFQLNAALRQPEGRVEAVRPWVGYIWLLLHALSKLPPSPAVLIFRGCVGTPKDLGLDLTPGATFRWGA